MAVVVHLYPDYYLLPVPVLTILIYFSITMKNWGIFLFYSLGATVMWAGTWYLLYHYFPQVKSANEFGDMFGCLASLFTGIGCAGLIMTLMQQNTIISETKEQTIIHFFYQTLNLYTAECNKWNHQKNGFIYSLIPPGIEIKDQPLIFNKSSEDKKDAALYHDIRVEASLYLSLLEYIYQIKDTSSKIIMKNILLNLLTVNKQRLYYAYLHITKSFPNLYKNKKELMQEGFFAIDGMVSQYFLERWGENLFKKLSEANQTNNI